MKLHILRCGTIRVSETVPFGNRINLNNTRRQLESLRWIAQMEKEPGCAAILCSHDPERRAGTIEF